MAEQVVHGVLEMEFAWNKGEGGFLFLTNLASRRLVGSRCEPCGLTCVPPRIFCGRCLKRTTHPVELPDRGMVESFTREAATGRTFVLVRIDGCDNLFLHRFCGVEEPYHGMRVRASWAETQRGEILDLEGFGPDGD